MNNEILLDLYAAALRDIEDFAKGLPDDRLAEQPGGLRNHPAWTLTHLCVANDFAVHVLFDLPPVCPPEWGPKARPGSTPAPNRAEYPPLTVLLDTLRRQHPIFTDAVRKAPADLFGRPTPEYLRKFSPTLGHLATYMLAVHENYHLAQLAQWKRAAGLGA
jgi:hypothetical protein